MSRASIRITLIIAIIVVIGQVLISLIYSNKILSLNVSFSNQRKTIANIQRSIEQLQNQLSNMESIFVLKNSSTSANLVPINKVLNLNE